MSANIFIEMDNLKRHRKIEKRYSKWLDKHWAVDAKEPFEWTKEKTEKIFTLNDAIIEKENNLYKLLADVKSDVDHLLTNGHTYYKKYDIDAFLSYEAEDFSTPTGDDKTMYEVYAATDFYLCNGLHTNAGEPLETLEKELKRDENYNWVWAFRDIPDREHYITRFLYKLVDQGTYTLDDLLYLNPEYFVPCIELRN